MLPCVTFTFLLQMVKKGGCDIKKTCDQNIFVLQQSLQSLKGIKKKNILKSKIVMTLTTEGRGGLIIPFCTFC